ncbi:TonB-dependent receptor plug domain-containing protein [Phenylobacterium sp.]|uniref:TonB-dependent receptor plug domain-containing protein n=1 Tax=Phenylobacterium sp. TaxID=1871053 RepID=UPI00286BEE4A|nr:TonB-dependent receptor plug domain-containing protein [Phenylobacterium sp.]
MHIRSGAHFKTVLLATGMTLGLAHATFAQTRSATKATEVDEVIVTGSALPTTLDAVAVPVSTVSAEKIAKSGVDSNALEILRKSLPAFEGRGNAGSSNANNTNQNTAGGSQARLRDLDTLVLINGRRAAVSAIAGVGGKIFVDVNQIPPSAIARVEVLQDGASAIYGSDAVGGVVNFILKHDFNGLEVGGRYAGAQGGYTEKSAYFTAGHSFGERLDVMLSGSYNQTDPLYQKDRSFTNPFILSSTAVPGAVGTFLLNPGFDSPSQSVPTGIAATAPSLAALTPGVYTASNAAAIGQTYPLSQFQTLLLGQKNSALTGDFTLKLDDAGRIEAFGDAEYAHGESFTQFLPRIAGVTVAAGAPFNPTTSTLSGVQFGVPQAPKQYRNTTDKFRITLGLRGDLEAMAHRWRWETAFTHSQDKLEQLQRNVIYGPNLPLAIAGGFDASGNALAGGRFSKVFSNFDTNAPLIVTPALDPFARGGRDPASLANILGTEVITGKSTLDTVDAKVTTELFKVPAGDVGLALGGAWRRESLAASADMNGRNTGPTAQRWIGGQFFDAFDKSRTISSAFAEMRVPITSDDMHVPGFSALDLIGAVRYENYSDAGSSTVPKLGFRWQPVDRQLTIRGTVSRSFTAPSLYAEYGPTATRQAGGAIILNAFPGQPSSPFNAEDGNNPSLAPAKSDSISLSAVYKPDLVPGLTLNVQYTNVRLKNIAGGIGFNNILVDVNRLGAASIFSANVAKNNFPGLPGAVAFANPGDLLAYLNAAPGVNNLNLYAIDQFRNLGGIKLSSIDFSADYVIPTQTLGTFTLDLVGAYLASYKYQALPSQPFYEFAGIASNSPQAGGTQPKVRLYATVDWTKGPWEAVIGGTYGDSVKDQGAGGFTFANGTAKALSVKSYTSLDAQMSYHFGDVEGLLKGPKVTVGVNNIANRMAPYAPNAFTDNRADVATYSPIGRLFYVTLDTRF